MYLSFSLCHKVTDSQQTLANQQSNINHLANKIPKTETSPVSSQLAMLLFLSEILTIVVPASTKKNILRLRVSRLLYMAAATLLDTGTAPYSSSPSSHPLAPPLVNNLFIHFTML